ncbi:MAG: hypothetical protein HUK09_06435 [Bacteroidaceae bacterium]|nr:hypothetical protein [Bacteroidaceae bacterium]
MSNPNTDKELRAQQQQRRILVIRNWLNGIFIVLALVAIVGVLLFKAGDIKLYISYGIAIVAILVKMVEAIFRMPGVFNKL